MAGSVVEPECANLVWTDLDPTKDHGVIDGHTTVGQQFFDMPVAQDIAERPADGAQDDVSFNVAPLE